MSENKPIERPKTSRLTFFSLVGIIVVAVFLTVLTAVVGTFALRAVVGPEATDKYVTKSRKNDAELVAALADKLRGIFGDKEANDDTKKVNGWMTPRPEAYAKHAEKFHTKLLTLAGQSNVPKRKRAIQVEDALFREPFTTDELSYGIDLATDLYKYAVLDESNPRLLAPITFYRNVTANHLNPLDLALISKVRELGLISFTLCEKEGAVGAEGHTRCMLTAFDENGISHGMRGGSRELSEAWLKIPLEKRKALYKKVIDENLPIFLATTGYVQEGGHMYIKRYTGIEL